MNPIFTFFASLALYLPSSVSIFIVVYSIFLLRTNPSIHSLPTLYFHCSSLVLHFKFYPPSFYPSLFSVTASFELSPISSSSSLVLPFFTFCPLPSSRLPFPSPFVSASAVSAPLCPPLPRSYLFGRLYLLSYLLVRFYRDSVCRTCRPAGDWPPGVAACLLQRSTKPTDRRSAARLVGPANWNCINSFLRRLLAR